MILIPEIKKVVILVPRTGSGSLYRAVLDRYPKAIMLYRHMEADGVPLGYDRWEKIGVCRSPLHRMWSLWKFMQNFSGAHHVPEYVEAVRKQGARPFEDWLLNNEVPFNSGYDNGYQGRFYPTHAVRHIMPENRKSQFIHLRPDLGTRVVPYRKVDSLWTELDLAPRRENVTEPHPLPVLGAEARRYVNKVFEWDFLGSQP